MPFLPPITWPDFLAAAPYFDEAIGRGLTEDAVLDAAPLPRAASFYGLFDGEVSNGGVMQYFFNQALSAPGFARAPDFVAENPVLAPALPFLREVHAAWDSVAPAVRAAREEDEWPERLFADHRPRFAALEDAFFKVNRGIAMRLAADVVARPRDYFAIPASPEVPERGVAHVVVGGTCHLRFEDGFPVGPNILETEEGGPDVVWFSRDRTLMTCESGYGGGRSRTTVHYPSGRSGAWTTEEGGAVEVKPTLALWTDHGLRERFRPDGTLDGAFLARNGGRAWEEYDHYPDGTPRLRIEYRGTEERAVSLWPNGAVNTESVTETGPERRERFLRCLDEAGRDLAPGGTGRFHQTLGERDGTRRWREGELRDGTLDGVVRWMAAPAGGGEARETGRATYRMGRGR